MNKRYAAIRGALSVSAMLFLLCSTVSAQPNTVTPGVERMSDGPMAAVNKELEQAAVAHRVRIRAGDAVFGSTSHGSVLLVGLAGIEKYRAADFARGAAIQLLIVKSADKRSAIPNGSYVVRVQFARGATSGRALFADSTGAVVVQRPLIIRTWAQSNVLFPMIYPIPMPLDIPVITSWHVWHDGHWCSDATGPGWDGRVAYYTN